MLTLNDAADAIRTGATSPTQLAAGCLERIEQTDGTLRAWAHVDRDGALRCAELLERELRDGVRRGPLHGVPIGVKDIIDVAAMPTRAGSPLRHGHMAATDAPVVAQLRAAGAIVLGKTVTTQFACFDPAETVNPWNPARTPGGSSSGSAVAVATGSCFAALGTQTGGSIIRPATYCGVVGMKPTRGRWSTVGVVPVSFHLDHVGPITRCVSDLWPIWQAVASDPPSHVVLPNHAADGCAACRSDGQAKLAFPAGFFRAAADRSMMPIIDSAVAQLVVAGAEVEDVELPARFEQVLEMHRRIMAVELAESHRADFEQHRDQYAEGIASLIAEGLSVSAMDYVAALKHRRVFIDDMLRVFGGGPGIWLTPATTSPAPGRESNRGSGVQCPLELLRVPGD